MSTFTGFYVKTDNIEKLIDILIHEMPQPTERTTGKFPNKFRDLYLNECCDPDYLLIGKHQENWITIIHNSFSLLERKCSKLSHLLNTKVIVIIMQTTSDYYYYADYEQGEKIREIMKCYSDDSDELNYGEKYSFEDEEVGVKTKHGYFFDWDAIEVYTEKNTLTSIFPEDAIEWAILRPNSQKSKQIIQSKTSEGKSIWKKIKNYFTYFKRDIQ